MNKRDLDAEIAAKEEELRKLKAAKSVEGHAATIKRLTAPKAQISQFAAALPNVFSCMRFDDLRVVSQRDYNSECGNNLQNMRCPELFRFVFDGGKWCISYAGANYFRNLNMCLIVQGKPQEEHPFVWLGFFEGGAQDSTYRMFGSTDKGIRALIRLYELVTMTTELTDMRNSTMVACARMFFGHVHAFLLAYLIERAHVDDASSVIDIEDVFTTGKALDTFYNIFA